MTVAPQRNALSENPAMSDEEASQAHGLMARLRETTAFWMFLVLLGLVVLFHHLLNHVFSLSNVFDCAGRFCAVPLVGWNDVPPGVRIDLSVGANVVLSSILAAKSITALAGTPDQVSMGEYPNLAVALVVGTMVAMASGMAYGLINGLMVTRLRLSSFLVTLATTAIGLGTALVITHGANVPDIPRVLQVSFATYRVGGIIPIPVLISLAIAAVLYFVLATTKFAVHTLALGSSPQAARPALMRRRICSSCSA